MATMNGVVITNIAFQDSAGSVIVDSNGNILVGGGSYIGGNLIDSHPILIRYNSDGSLDLSFDQDGITGIYGNFQAYGYSLAMQTDGKIIEAGGSASGRFAYLARYNSDGSLDTNFDGDGIATVFSSSIQEGRFDSIAIQEDGKILATGGAVLARFNVDGSLDTNFNYDGIVSTTFASTRDYSYGLTLQTDGKILVVGTSYNGNTDSNGNYFNSDFALARYNADASLDSSFDSDGIVTTSISNTYDSAVSVTVQPDGKILVAGSGGITSNSTSNSYAVVRYNIDGSLDTSFGNNGIVTTDIGFYADGRSITLQHDGKILVSGGGILFSMVRYNSNGSLDLSFDGDGKVVTDLGTGFAQSMYATLQPDGKILVTGNSGIYPNIDIALVRYNSDGSLDATFNGGITSINPPTATNQTVTLDEDNAFTFSNATNLGYNDVDGDSMASVKITSLPTAGSLQLNGSAVSLNQSIPTAVLANLTFIPTANANGTNYSSFGFTVNDGSLDSVPSNTVTFNVNPVNDSPTGYVTISNTAPVENQMLSVSNTLADADGLGTIQYQWQVAGVTKSTEPTYTVLSSDVGKTISVTASYVDGAGNPENVSSAATNPITAINHPPFDVTVSPNSVNENVPANTPIGNFSSSDPDSGNTFTYSLESGVADNDLFFITANNQLQLKISPDFESKSSYNISVKTTDQGFLSFTKTLTIAVNNLNEPPTGSATGLLVAGDEDKPYQIDLAKLLEGFSDVDGDTLNIANLSVTNSSGILSDLIFTPNLNYNGVVDLSYNVIDGNGGSITATQSFNLNPVNDAPVLTIPAIIHYTDTRFDDDFTISNGILSATDIDSSPLTYSIVDGIHNVSAHSYTKMSAYGKLTLNENSGVYSFEPNDIAIEKLIVNATASFTVKVFDGLLSDSQTLSIEIVQSGTTESIGNDALMGTLANNKFDGLAGDDIIKGLKGSDTLLGNSGNDQLDGGAGNDSLDGGANNDVLIGGAGQDDLTGGNGRDVFVFNKINDTLKTTPDTIEDFKSVDKIDLSAIDANITTAGNNAFNSTFASSLTTMAIGSLFFDSGTNMLYGNVNANPNADFAIHLIGVTNLSITDIVL